MENPKQKQLREKRDKEIKKIYPDLTMEEIGRRYKITRRRVSQIIQGRTGSNKTAKTK